VGHRFAQGNSISMPWADLGQHHQALGTAAFIAPAEDCHAALAHTLDCTHCLLDFLRIQVAAAPDHDVLEPSGDENVPLGQVSPVTGVEPLALAVGEQPRRQLWCAPVACGGRWPAKLQPPLDPFRHHGTGIVHDSYLVPGQHSPAGHEPQRRGLLAWHRSAL